LVVPFADCVVSIRNGEILLSGTPAEVTKAPEDESLFGLDLSQDNFEDEEEENDKVAVATGVGGGTQLVDDEEKSSGSVKLSVYKSYFVATGGAFFLILFIIGFVLTTSSTVGNDWWLKVPLNLTLGVD
jgi:ATP-binding cassette, subfamily C (CFTR/MRP), member 10